jgi:hypothetical protein
MEKLWRALLSEQADSIRQAIGELTAEEAEAVIAHLRKMAAQEEGYSEVQRRAAARALEVIQSSLSKE